MTGALWAKRGENDISKYRVRPAWLIKRLSCRLKGAVTDSWDRRSLLYAELKDSVVTWCSPFYEKSEFHSKPDRRRTAANKTLSAARAATSPQIKGHKGFLISRALV